MASDVYENTMHAAFCSARRVYVGLQVYKVMSRSNFFALNKIFAFLTC